MGKIIPSVTTIRNDNGKNDEMMKQIDKLSTINSYHHPNQDTIIVNKNDNAILLEISFQSYALLTVGAPVLAFITVFLFGFLLDYQQILDYDWICGSVEMPSFSRIINSSKERIIWNALILSHLPLRILLILINYRICRIPSNEVCNHKLHAILSGFIIFPGSIEILTILLLTITGEREEPAELHDTHFNWHVYFFIIFVISSTVYFAVITTTYRNSKHYTEHFNGRWSFELKFYLTLIYIALIPVTFIFFMMYWILCYNFAYNFFAISEYLLILVNYAFHATIIYDCNDIYQFKIPKHQKIA